MSSFPSTQNSIASNSNKSSGVGVQPVRAQQSAWGLPAPGTSARRGLTPLSTNLGSSGLDSSGSGRVHNTASPSPFTPSFSSVLNSSNADPGRHTHSSASTLFTQQSGSQQAPSGQTLLSPRSRAITPSSNPLSASSAAASTTASQGGGGGSGGGGISRTQTFSPSLQQHLGLSSPTSNTFDRSPYTGSNSSSAASGQSSVSKIVVTQVFLLLGSITEKEGKAKWDSQAEAIHKLVESNGMEVYSKYFRRLLVGNSPTIFPSVNRNVENPSNYHLLVQEIEKITKDPEQALKIAEIIDASEGDIFRDFDLLTFTSHFKLDPLAKTLLASAFTRVSRADLKAKAATMLSSNRDQLFSCLANAHNDKTEVSPSLLATCATSFLDDLPQNDKSDLDIQKLAFALKHRYSKQNVPIPSEILSTLVLFDLPEIDHPLVKDLKRQGPQVTSNLGAMKEFLSSRSVRDTNESGVAAALMYMVLSPARHQYSPSTFVSAVHEPLDTAYWQNVIEGFDVKGLDITKAHFIVIFNALFPICRQNSQVDIQRLWGGRWRNPQTQLSFLRSFLSCSSEELDITSTPNFRRTYEYSSEDMSSVPESLAQQVETAQRDPMISLDAITAIYDLLVRPDDLPTRDEHLLLAETVGIKEAFFLCSSLAIDKPWSEGQLYIMKSLLAVFLRDERPDGHYALHTIWKLDKSWVANSLIDAHMRDPLELTVILEQAQEHGWLDDLYTLWNGFGLDLAALAHRNGVLKLDEWAEEKLAQNHLGFVNAVSKFLVLKAQDELRTARDEQPVPCTVSLSLGTVRDMLDLLDQHMADRNELKALQRQCLQAYPRLIIDIVGLDHSLDVDCKQSNKLSKVADQEMQDLYKRMYNADLKVENIIEYLQECKDSKDPAPLDIFACMIHGLFDEFSCFGEYPLGPLATTAVLFGGIISVGLITGLALRVGQEMILDAVRDYPQEASMYKFGLQALLHILERLKEPEWSDYCSQLVKIPGLRGTEPHRIALQILAENGVLKGEMDEANVNGMADGLPNGDIDSFVSSELVPQFKSVSAEPASAFDEPDEDTQEKIVFFFNNVSEQNLKSRFNQLQEALQSINPRWFASFLVEGRAKVEPNYQPLYLDILNLLGNKILWNEVLRETYVSVKKLLNADSTMQLASERKNLKNLSIWLGSLTIARDKPIKHKNISFLDLLIEGYETQRLNLVIPFTCNVLVQGTKSLVFKPPNPWVVEIMSTLLELYMHFDIKLNHKFEIEVLFKEFGSTMTQGSESDHIRTRPLHEETLANALLADGPEGFEDMSLGSINRTVRNPRFELDSLSSTLPDLEAVLSFPPATGSSASQAKLHDIVHESVRRAILEIIAPVVERSVTIATIAASALIHKDFAREPDEDRVRRSAHQMVRQLSGSLALVTCKEPLKMSMTNYIRMAQAQLPDQAFPEGAILMSVNDNLDIACSVVEKQAEERSMPEIEAHIEAEIAARRQHRINNPNESFQDPAFSHWSTFIPEPYKQSFSGLNQEQMAIYLDFARQSRGPASHGQTSSADSGRQVPDVLQDTFAPISGVHTPATDLSLPHQPSQQQQQQAGRMLPPSVPTPMSANHVNGYMDLGAVQDRLQEFLGDISRLLKENSEKSISDVQDDLPSVVETLNQAWELVASSPDSIAMNCAEDICKAVYGDSMTRLEIEIFVHLLARLCQVYPNIRKEVAVWAASQNEMKMLNLDVTIALVKTEIMPLKQVDTSVAGLFYKRIEGVVDFFSDVMEALLLNDHPIALRADFSRSLGALGQWLIERPNHQTACALVQKLRDWGVRQVEDVQLDEPSMIKKHQLQYIFAEWTAICNSYPKTPNDQVFTAFIFQLHQKQLLNSEEDMAVFIRLCVDEALKTYMLGNIDTDEGSNEAFHKVDWLARLIVLLVKNQGEQDGAVQLNKNTYMKSILALITLIINNHQVLHGEHFNQRFFFRLLSSILCDWHDFARESHGPNNDMLLVFAETFRSLPPRFFPGFTYSWLMLISHRLFMPNLLKLSNDQGWEPFAKIMEEALSYVCQFLKPDLISPLAIDLYRGILRIILVLHHDFPEFLAENHFRLCNSIPRHCTQLYNLVLSAYPSSFPELPNPFVVGLKVDRLEEMRKEPRMNGDHIHLLLQAKVKHSIDTFLRNQDTSGDELSRLANAAYLPSGRSITVNSSLLHAIVLYIGQSAASSPGQKAGQVFALDSPQFSCMTKLAKELHPEARYFFFSAMANQLRYPNSHTQYFSHAILHLFGAEFADQQESDIRQQITRVLLERLHVIKPHPWGLVITVLELIKNQDYAFFQLPFIKASPPIRAMCEDLLVTAQERERWSDQFNQ